MTKPLVRHSSLGLRITDRQSAPQIIAPQNIILLPGELGIKFFAKIIRALLLAIWNLNVRCHSSLALGISLPRVASTTPITAGPRPCIFWRLETVKQLLNQKETIIPTIERFKRAQFPTNSSVETISVCICCCCLLEALHVMKASNCLKRNVVGFITQSIRLSELDIACSACSMS